MPCRYKLAPRSEISSRTLARCYTRCGSWPWNMWIYSLLSCPCSDLVAGAHQAAREPRVVSRCQALGPGALVPRCFPWRRRHCLCSGKGIKLLTRTGLEKTAAPQKACAGCCHWQTKNTTMKKRGTRLSSSAARQSHSPKPWFQGLRMQQYILQASPRRKATQPLTTSKTGKPEKALVLRQGAGQVLEKLRHHLQPAREANVGQSGAQSILGAGIEPRNQEGLVIKLQLYKHAIPWLFNLWCFACLAAAIQS